MSLEIAVLNSSLWDSGQQRARTVVERVFQFCKKKLRPFSKVDVSTSRALRHRVKPSLAMETEMQIMLPSRGRSWF